MNDLTNRTEEQSVLQNFNFLIALFNSILLPMGLSCRLRWFSLVEDKLPLARDKSRERGLNVVFGKL